jgi:DNA-binding transcriptional LysR family regulator
MDRFESLKVFATVVEAGSFSAAARRLGTPLATVSRKVSELEALLKVRLLNRSTRQVRPTDGGERFYRTGRRILDELAEAERLASGEYAAPRGELIVTAPIVFGRLHMVPVICAFLGEYPEVEIKLQLSDRNLDLLGEHIDLALRIGALADSSMIAQRLGEVRWVVCASPAYLERRGLPRHPRQLGAHDCVAFANLEAPREWVFRDGGKLASHAINPRLTVTTAEAAIDAAISGLGVTRVLSYQVAGSARAKSLEIILADFEPDAMPVSLVHAGGRTIAQKLRAFLDFAAPRLKARLKPQSESI